MGRSWPLTGRADELRFIEAASRRGGTPRGVVLAGAAGVGKTRLAREALSALSRRGAATRWAVGTASARSLPLGAFMGLAGDVDPGPTRVIGATMSALLAGAPPAGVVVGVDDAHLLDELSALIVRELVVSAAAPVVLTLRNGEQAPDAITALWKDGHLDRLEVQPLSEAETAALLEAVLGGPVASGTADRLWALTRGNTLFLRQLVDGELETGQLAQARGVWRWSGQPAVSAGLAELVSARMGALPENLAGVMDALALAEPIEVPVLAGLTSPADIEEAETRGLVELHQDGRRWQAALAHPLYGEVRRPRIGRLRARRLRGELATALAGTGGRRTDDTLRRATLTVSSDLPPDPGLLTSAARDAIRLLDVPMSERLARAAVDAGGGFDARFTLALALSWIDRPADSEAEFAALAGQAASAEQHTAIAVPRAANLFWPGRDPARAEAVLSAAEEAADTSGRRVVAAARAAIDAFLGRSQAGVAAAESALAAPGLSDVGLLLATYGSTVGLAALGRADEIAPIAARGYQVAPRSVATAVGLFGQCDIHLNALYVAGYLNEMDGLAHEHYQRATRMPGNTRLYGVALRGYAARYQGRLGAAVRDLREAWAGFASYEKEGHGFRTLLSLTHALAQAGDAAGARRALADLEAERHPAFVFSDPEVLQARGWVAAAEGALTEGIRLAREGASLAAARGQPGYEVLALHTAVRFGDRTAAGRLAELATLVDGPRASAAAAHAAALATDDGGALRAASVRLEQMGDLTAAGDAAGHAAAAHRRHGEDTAARMAAASARRLAGQCEGARTPALADATCPLPLTGREREIATLAAGGLSNRAIAERLVVSVRTVEGHLYRASAKLGASTRVEFAALLRGD